MVAIEYVYEIFTETQLQSLNQTNKNYRTSLRPLMFPKLYIPNMRHSCMLCLLMIIGANVFFFKLLKTDRTVQ